jgi:putative MATE family efflux protein
MVSEKPFELIDGNRASARTEAIVSAPVARTIFRLTAPMVGGIVALMIMGIVDAYFVGQLGLNELAALGFVLPVTQSVNSLGLGIGMALSVLVSRYFGQQKIALAARLITDSRLLVIFLGVTLQGVLYFTITPLFRLIGADELVQSYAAEYMVLWVPVIPLLLLTLTGNTTLRAIGSPAKSATVLTLLAVLNALLDPLLIFGYGPLPGLGIGGAALASSIAWLITYAVSDYMLGVQEKLILRGKFEWQSLTKNWQQLATIGVPAVIANFVTPLAVAILTAMIATFGAEAVAGFTVASRIEALCLLVVFALSSTLPTFVGQNIGAGRADRARKALFGALGFSVALQFVVWLLMLLSASSIGPVFNDSQAVISVVTIYLWVVPISYGAQAVVILVMVTLNVLKRPQTALLITVSRLLLISLPLAYLGGQYGGAPGLFCGFTVGNVIAGIIAWRLIQKVWREEEKVGFSL